MLPLQWCAGSFGTIWSEKNACSRAVLRAAGRSLGSIYAKVERYTSPGKPCPNVPGIGATASVFITGGPNRPEKKSSDGDKSSPTALTPPRGSGVGAAGGGG